MIDHNRIARDRRTTGAARPPPLAPAGVSTLSTQQRVKAALPIPDDFIEIGRAVIAAAYPRDSFRYQSRSRPFVSLLISKFCLFRRRVTVAATVVVPSVSLAPLETEDSRVACKSLIARDGQFRHPFPNRLHRKHPLARNGGALIQQRAQSSPDRHARLTVPQTRSRCK